MLKETIENCIATKTFITGWKTAADLAGYDYGDKWAPSHIPNVVKLFNEAYPDGSAVVVNQEGQYGKQSVLEGHMTFLTTHNMPIPGVAKPKAKKVSKKSTDIDPAMLAMIIKLVQAMK